MANDAEHVSKLIYAIECTTEDASYPATELLYQTQETKGWQSAKYCKYPQEMLLRFNGFVRIKQIQILCHEYKICSRMEISAGLIILKTNGDEDIEWKKLGSLSFDTNERSGYLARELKSVHVNAECDVIRLRLFQCHTNKLNTHNQIGVVAINVLGESLVDVAPVLHSYSSAQYSRQQLVQYIQPNVASSIEAFDTKTQKEYQKLLRLKEIAVASEDYDEAKRLKGQLEIVRALGTRLAQLEAQKSRAVEDEDYDLAKKLKEDIAQARANAFNQKRSFPSPNPSQHSSERTTSLSSRDNDHLTPSSDHCDVRRKESVTSSDISPDQNRAEAAYDFTPRERSKHEEYDERVAQSQGRYDEASISSQPLTLSVEAEPSPSVDIPEGFPPDLPRPEPLSATNAKTAQPLEKFSGEYVAQCFYSRTWQLREAALLYLQSNFDRLIQEGHEREQIRLLCHVVVKGLKDKVPNVFLTSTSFIQTIITSSKTQARDIQLATADFVPLLIDKLGENNPRIRDAAHESIMTFARLKESGIKNMVSMFLRPSKKQAAWRPVLSRLELIDELIDVIGVGKNVSGGLELSAVMQFIGKAYSSPNADVRSSAISLTSKIAGIVGPVVKRFIPDDVNPNVYKQLTQELATVVSTPPSQSTCTSPLRHQSKNAPASSISETPVSPQSTVLQSDSEDPAVYALQLKKQEQLLGSDHPDLIDVLTSLAAIYTQREQYDDAQPLLNRVLEITRKQYGPEHSNVAHALTDLAILHMEQGRDEDGRPLLERALAIKEKNLGSTHPDVVAIRDVLTSGND